MKKASTYKQQDRAQIHPIVNWQDHELGDSLSYAYRSTIYNSNTFPSSLHYHDYYELVILESGNIEYICESVRFQPKPADVLLVSPGMFHMSKIGCEETCYKRHVFYLYPDALDMLGCEALTSFIQNAEPGLTVFSLQENDQTALFSLLHQLSDALDKKALPAYQALAKGLVIQIFFLLGKGEGTLGSQALTLPNTLLSIKQYIEENLTEISSVKEIADHFFFSREYVSRIFRKHFNTTISEYIQKRRIAYSQSLIEQGCSIGESCYQAGFENMSTYIRSFKSVLSMTPSEYRKKIKKA